MKKRIFFIISALLLSSSSLFATQLTLNAESGNRGIEEGNCWRFGAQTYTSTDNVISGHYSIRSNQLTSLLLTACWIKTPWMKIGSGNITFNARMNGSTGTSRAIVVSYIAYDPSSSSSSKEGTVTSFYTYNFPAPMTSTTIQSISVPIPVAIENSYTVYKIMVSFIGQGGTGRVISDNYVFPGTYWSNPCHDCLPQPIPPLPDTDGDGINDEDEDYPLDPNRAYNSYFPSATQFGTLAYEDNWPAKGDYDFNDVVVNYKLMTVTNASNNVVEVISTFVMRAAGASFHNGFGFQMDGIASNKISGVSGNQVAPASPVFSIAANGVESAQPYATTIVFDDFFSVMGWPGAGIGVNTDKSATYVTPVTKTVTATFINNGVAPPGGTVPLTSLSSGVFNFFIVANSSRGYEIHLPDRVPTALANLALLGTRDDNSNPYTGRYFKTLNNLPWGINIIQGYDYTIEKAAIEEGYLHFVEWAESAGVSYPDWFLNSPGYRNPLKIY